MIRSAIISPHPFGAQEPSVIITTNDRKVPFRWQESPFSSRGAPLFALIVPLVEPGPVGPGEPFLGRLARRIPAVCCKRKDLKQMSLHLA